VTRGSRPRGAAGGVTFRVTALALERGGCRRTEALGGDSVGTTFRTWVDAGLCEVRSAVAHALASV
jgi:hypothetical protein